MIVPCAIFLIGLCLSAFFSGSETGFYRVTRVRLLLDALQGDWVARGLLWLTNNPALFVSTALVGSNLANYLISMAIVMVTSQFLPVENLAVELLSPVAFAPVLFVYGDLLPKNLFYHAPNQLLRRAGPPFLFFTVLFAPVSALLWMLGRVLQSLLGEAPLQVRFALARKELQQVLEEGHEAGLLRPAQRMLAQNLFAIASQTVGELCTPVSRMAAIRLGTPKAEVLRFARRHRVAAVPVVDARGREVVGYVRIVDLHLHPSERIDNCRTLPTIRDSEPHIVALIHLQSSKEEIARVVDAVGNTVGLLYVDELTDPLFRGT